MFQKVGLKMMLAAETGEYASQLAFSYVAGAYLLQKLGWR